MFATYAVAIFAVLFSAMSGLTWIYTVGHFDPPNAGSDENRVREHDAAA